MNYTQIIAKLQNVENILELGAWGLTFLVLLVALIIINLRHRKSYRLLESRITYLEGAINFGDKFGKKLYNYANGR